MIDNDFFYCIYVVQQDNLIICICYCIDGSSIGEFDWELIVGGESVYIVVDFIDNEIVFGGSYGGYLIMKNYCIGECWVVNVWLDNLMGYGVEGMKYWFQWNFLLFFLFYNLEKFYVVFNYLYVSINGG